MKTKKAHFILSKIYLHFFSLRKKKLNFPPTPKKINKNVHPLDDISSGLY